jgi:chromate transporter
MTKLLQLTGVFGLLSVLAVGGGVAVLPEMKHLTVEEHGWVTADQFVDIYSLGQMAPGPNMLMVIVIGYRVAGVVGALAVLVAFFLPAGLLTFGAGRLWIRLEGWPWRLAIQRGLAPVSIGLMLAGTITIARVAFDNLTSVAMAAAVLVILLSRHINPAYLILASGVVGWLVLT